MRSKDKNLLTISVIFTALTWGWVSAENSTLTNRSGKQGGLFSVVSFPNDACTASNGLNGTCMTGTECAAINGEAKGTCAKGFGTCCFVKVNQCGVDIKYNRTYIQNAEFPDGYKTSTDTECNYRFLRQSKDTCQVRLDFTVFDIVGPWDPTATTLRWECVKGKTDYVTVQPADNVHSDLVLCGYNNGHHLYIDMGTETSNPNYATWSMSFDGDTTYSFFNRRWNILVSYIDCGTPYTPPRGCDRYYWGNSGTGTVLAYNYDNPSTDYAARLNGDHVICLRREKGMCQISYVPPDIDDDDEGFTINGNPAALFKGRVACGHPASTPCLNYVRIPQGTRTGMAPFNAQTTGPDRCDRFCGRRLCLKQQSCTSADHNTVITRQLPFTLQIELGPHRPHDYENRGYKLNYVQSKC